MGYTALAASMTAPDWLTDEQAGRDHQLAPRRWTARGRRPSALKIYELQAAGEGAAAEPSAEHRTRCGAAWRRGCGTRSPSPTPRTRIPGSWARWWPRRASPRMRPARPPSRSSSRRALYRAVLDTQDRFGKKVTALLLLRCSTPTARRCPSRFPRSVAAPEWSLEPGEEFMALWGTGYERAGRSSRSSIATRSSRHSGPSRARRSSRQAGRHRGHARRLHGARDHGPREPGLSHSRQVDVPWTNKELDLKPGSTSSPSSSRARRRPGRAVISRARRQAGRGRDGGRMYDESLDAYLPHVGWASFNVFREDSSNLASRFENMAEQFHQLRATGRATTRTRA